MLDSISSVGKRSFLGEQIARIPSNVTLAVFAGLAAFVTIFVLAELTLFSKQLLLIAPFGASCVLVFALPDSPLAQNRNLIGGHLISALVGLIVFHLLGTNPLAYGIGVGCAITAMVLTKTTHPPAGADPIVVIAMGAPWGFLFAPVLVGTLLIASFAWAWRQAKHRATAAKP